MAICSRLGGFYGQAMISRALIVVGLAACLGCKTKIEFKDERKREFRGIELSTSCLVKSVTASNKTGWVTIEDMDGTVMRSMDFKHWEKVKP